MFAWLFLVTILNCTYLFYFQRKAKHFSHIYKIYCAIFLIFMIILLHSRKHRLYHIQKYYPALPGCSILVGLEMWQLTLMFQSELTLIILPKLLLSLLLWISILTSCFKLYYWFYFSHPLKKNSSRPATGTDKCVSHLQRARESMLENFIAGINSLYSQLQGGIREYMECLKNFVSSFRWLLVRYEICSGTPYIPVSPCN